MRLSPITELDEAQTELLVRTLGPGATPPPPFLIWAHNVAAAHWVEGLGAYCRNESKFPQRIRELAVLIPARHFDSVPAWNAHYQHAIDEGVPAECLHRIARNEDPQFEASDEQIFYDFARQMLDAHFVSDDVYSAARDAFGEDGLIDLVTSIGSFSISSMALNVFHVEINPELGRPFSNVDDFGHVSGE